MFWLFVMNLTLFAGGYLSAAIAREMRPGLKQNSEIS
jgi:hypothetical protein